MLEGIFVTVTPQRGLRSKAPFPIGAELLCCKDPHNTYDTEAIRVFAKGGQAVGYISNSTNTKANGTMSAARVYDLVGDRFIVEVCFTTQTKVICRVLCRSVDDAATALEDYRRPKTLEDVYSEQTGSTK